MKSRAFVSLTCLTLAVVLAGCEATTPPPEAKDQFETVRKAFDDYLSSDPAAATTAATVFDSLNDGDDTTTPYVISARSPEHYALGHVPGAVNIPWRTVANVGALDDLPTDQPIIVYCYTGHTGAVATAVINAMGHEAVNMKYGMCAWTRDADIRAAAPFNEETSSDFPTVTDVPDEMTYDLPTMDVTDSTDDGEIVRAAAEAYLSGDESPIIAAEDLFDLLNDGDETNDPFIISVRAPEAYALGHIEGAINIPWKTIAQEANLKRIPTDRDIVVYCYTGHTGGLATTVLNVLGYNAKNMKFGMVAWTKDADIRATSAFDDAVDSNDFATEP
ncbi:MAG TPA: rhodanese-like domain-containing protein [Phycisphaerae bacterium]|nr:rhodanese-like domain-containing protein [Phycisphaerae bacterium]